MWRPWQSSRLVRRVRVAQGSQRPGDLLGVTMIVALIVVSVAWYFVGRDGGNRAAYCADLKPGPNVAALMAAPPVGPGHHSLLGKLAGEAPNTIKGAWIQVFNYRQLSDAGGPISPSVASEAAAAFQRISADAREQCGVALNPPTT